jgi:predicted membrane chloride channel (bestrophin family)
MGNDFPNAKRHIVMNYNFVYIIVILHGGVILKLLRKLLTACGISEFAVMAVLVWSTSLSSKGS